MAVFASSVKTHAVAPHPTREVQELTTIGSDKHYLGRAAATQQHTNTIDENETHNAKLLYMISTHGPFHTWTMMIKQIS